MRNVLTGRTGYKQGLFGIYLIVEYEMAGDGIGCLEYHWRKADAVDLAELYNLKKRERYIIK